VTVRKRKSTTLAVIVATLTVACVTNLLADGAGRKRSTSAQNPPAAASPGAPAANPADVASIDAILHAAYDTISGPAGRQRDWNRFRSLFVPGARLIPVVADPKGGFHTVVLSADDYVKHGDPYFQKNGFFEQEVARRTEHFGSMAEVFSTYESRHNAADPKPFERGINSFQLMNDGHRWWIVTVFWQGETADNPIPKKYLQGNRE